MPLRIKYSSYNHIYADVYIHEPFPRDMAKMFNPGWQFNSEWPVRGRPRLAPN